MEEAAIIQHLKTLPHLVHISADGNSFFYYNPEGTMPEKTFPFATLVTTDQYDSASNLSREGVCRLNIGVRKSKFDTLFEPGAEHDFTALDVLMPHPVYGEMCWVCVLNPGEKSWRTTLELLVEAYQRASRSGID